MTDWGGGHCRGAVPSPAEVLEGPPSDSQVFCLFVLFCFNEEVAKVEGGILSKGAGV